MSSGVVVVGAGVIGCAIARELAVRGVTCTVCDPRPVAGGATQASAGMLAPYLEAHERGPLLDLAVRSLELYDDWISAVRRESGAEIEFRRIGTLETATQRSIPAHGYVAAAPLAGALAAAAERAGAVFVRSRVERVASEGGSLTVHTASATFDAATVVMAAGAWVDSIAGVRMPPIRPVRGQLLYLRWQAAPLSTIIWGPACYVVPWIDGTVLVGATMEEAGYDERNTADGVRALLAAVCDLLPEARSATFLGARVGLRPATPDDLPVIGSDPRAPGVIHASGHYRNGILLAPITARLVADLVVNGRSDPILDSFRPDRF